MNDARAPHHDLSQAIASKTDTCTCPDTACASVFASAQEDIRYQLSLQALQPPFLRFAHRFRLPRQPERLIGARFFRLHLDQCATCQLLADTGARQKSVTDGR